MRSPIKVFTAMQRASTSISFENREHGFFHVIPSFLIVNAGDETLADIAKRLLVRGTAAKEDWGRPMAYTRQFGSNFFARAGAEIRDTYNSMLAEARSKGEEPSDFLKMTELRYGHIPDFKDAKIPSWTEASMTPDLLVVSQENSRFRRLSHLRQCGKAPPGCSQMKRKPMLCLGNQSFNLLRAMGSVCQNDRVHRTAHAMKDRYDIFGGLPDTIEDDWIESEEKLEEMMDDTSISESKHVTSSNCGIERLSIQIRTVGSFARGCCRGVMSLIVFPCPGERLRRDRLL